MMTPTMKPQNHFFWIFVPVFFLAACVSVNLKPKEPTKSSEYKLLAPEKPFEKIKNEQADEAWQNPRTGNTIAILSECSEQRDPSLETLEEETIQALNSYRVLKTETLQFQERAARRSRVEGQMDGVPVQMDVLVVKKNTCSYTLTYMGRATGIEKDRSSFENFLARFEIP